VREEIMSKNLLLIILAVLFIGCAYRAGRKYDTTAIDRIAVGQTTESDVITMLGMPLSENKLSNGITVFQYTYGEGCPLGFGNSIDSLQVQCYGGVVINKIQNLRQN
jgi:hypothetical protein